MKPNGAGPAEADDLIQSYDAQTQELINAARSVLRAAFPGIKESCDPKVRLFGYSYGPGYKGTVATLILSKSAVKIGIPFGSSLSDPKHLLAGAGKVHRHVAITKRAGLQAPALRALLKEALQAWRTRNGGGSTVS